MIPIKVSLAAWFSGVMCGGFCTNTGGRIVDMGGRGAVTAAVTVNVWVTSAHTGGGLCCIETPGVGGQDLGDVTSPVSSGDCSFWAKVADSVGCTSKVRARGSGGVAS